MVRSAIGHRRTNHVARTRAVGLSEALGQCDVHKAIITSTTRHTMGRTILTAVPLGHENFDLGTRQRRVVFSADTLLKPNETLVALESNIIGNLVLAVGSGRTRATRVQEGKGRRKTRLFHDVQGRLEVLFRLTGETHDDIGRDGGLRNRGAHTVQNAHETLAAV